MNRSMGFVWRHATVRALLAIVPAWCTAAVLLFGAPLSMKLIVGAMLAGSLASPYRALIAIALFVPLGDLTGVMLHLGSYRLDEAVTVAFLCGWLVRGDSSVRGPRVAGWAGWTAAAAVLASMLAAAARAPGAFASAFEWMFYGYYLSPHPIGWVDGARLLEGIALAAAVVSVFRRRPQLATTLPAALTGSAVVAAASSALLWYRIAPAEVLHRSPLIGYRVAAHLADVNAAGSYFALSFCVAAGMAVRSRGRRTLWWVIGTVACGVGMWLAASRTANAAAFAAVASAAAWWTAATWPRPRRIALATAALVIVVAAAAVQLRSLTRDPGYRSADFRRGFNESSVRMIAAAPWSGVGIGRYMLVSPLFLGPPVAYSYGAENAHNYFLQLAAELGLLGCAAVFAWILVGLARGVRALAFTPRDARVLGLVAGIAAFIATWFTGHPMLLLDAAAPFWIAFGLMFGLSESALMAYLPAHDASRVLRLAAVAAVGVIGLGQSASVRAALRPPDSRDVTGLYEWETDSAGTRYRWTEEYASIFVPADVTRVYIPVRVPFVPSISPMLVEVRTEGRPGTRSTIGSDWAILNVELPDAAPYVEYKRVNLHVERTWRPALYVAGSSDMREVGVQTGEIKLFRER